MGKDNNPDNLNINLSAVHLTPNTKTIFLKK